MWRNSSSSKLPSVAVLQRTLKTGRPCFVRDFRRGAPWLSVSVISPTGPISLRVQVHLPQGPVIWRRHRDHLQPTPQGSDRPLTTRETTGTEMPFVAPGEESADHQTFQSRENWPKMPPHQLRCGVTRLENANLRTGMGLLLVNFWV